MLVHRQRRRTRSDALEWREATSLGSFDHFPQRVQLQHAPAGLVSGEFVARVPTRTLEPMMVHFDERAAKRASAGWEAEISIATEILFPTWLMFHCLDRFGKESPQTRIEWFETVLDGTPEALRTGKADLAITGSLPQGVPGELLLQYAKVLDEPELAVTVQPPRSGVRRRIAVEGERRAATDEYAFDRQERGSLLREGPCDRG